MTPEEHHNATPQASGHSRGHAVHLLETLDNWAHIVVAAFFILMASTVIIHMGFIFLRQLPLIVPAPNVEAQSPVSSDAANARKSAASAATESAPTPRHAPAERAASETTSQPTADAPNASGEKASAMPAAAQGTPAPTSTATMEESHAQAAADPFVRNSLELLSNILFVVILLELLRTIITYLETHDIQAIMQEFLVVGIISSVRKILLVGAEASLVGSKGMEFIQEATGVVIDIAGILLLILGLVMLKRAFGSKVQKEIQEV